MEIDHPAHPRNLPPELMQRAHRTWTTTAKNVRISHLHSEVSQLLNTMGIPHTVEHLTDGELFSMDLAIPGEAHAHTHMLAISVS